MLKKISNYDEVEKWLNILIQERISKEISLRLNKDKNKWIIRSKKYKKLMNILIDDYFYSIGYQSDLSCIYINLEIIISIPNIKDYLPQVIILIHILIFSKMDPHLI